METYASGIKNETLTFTSGQEDRKPVSTGTVIATVFMAITVGSTIILTNSNEPVLNLEDKSENKLNFQTLPSDKSNNNATMDLNSKNTLYSSENILNFDNRHLEVEDLADRVTQTQIQEIKDHFDTKINDLETNLTLKYENYADKKIEELKSFISNENKEIKNSKKESRRFWIDSVIIPLAIVFITIFLTKHLGLY